MPPDRPYFGLSAAELRDKATSAEGNPAAILKVLHELSFRKSAAAERTSKCTVDQLAREWFPSDECDLLQELVEELTSRRGRLTAQIRSSLEPILRQAWILEDHANKREQVMDTLGDTEDRLFSIIRNPELSPEDVEIVWDCIDAIELATQEAAGGAPSVAEALMRATDALESDREQCEEGDEP